MTAVKDLLAEQVRGLLPSHRITEQRMFGGIAFMLDGHMLCCVSVKGVMFRVGAAGEAAALDRPYAEPCLGTGRAMTGFVMVQPAGLQDASTLSEWLELARAYCETLPPRAVRSLSAQ
jgi:hypothetical protein